jgi:hypothetical protein
VTEQLDLQLHALRAGPELVRGEVVDGELQAPLDLLARHRHARRLVIAHAHDAARPVDAVHLADDAVVADRDLERLLDPDDLVPRDAALAHAPGLRDLETFLEPQAVAELTLLPGLAIRAHDARGVDRPAVPTRDVLEESGLARPVQQHPEPRGVAVLGGQPVEVVKLERAWTAREPIQMRVAVDDSVLGQGGTRWGAKRVWRVGGLSFDAECSMIDGSVLMLDGSMRGSRLAVPSPQRGAPPRRSADKKSYVP